MALKHICLLILISASITSCSEKVTSDIISVSITITGKGNLPSCNKCDGENYSTVCTITNNKDSAIHFKIMSCSWSYSWICSNDSIYFYYPGCDSNFPIGIELDAHKSIRFYGVLRSIKKDLANKNFRLGFVMLNENEFLPSINEAKLMQQKIIFWSNKETLESHSAGTFSNNLYGYEIEN